MVTSVSCHFPLSCVRVAGHPAQSSTGEGLAPAFVTLKRLSIPSANTALSCKFLIVLRGLNFQVIQEKFGYQTALAHTKTSSDP